MAIFGNRLCFRPILYFYQFDVLLTTPFPISYTTENHEICTTGLCLLYTLVKVSSFPFKRSQLAKFPKSGWREAVGNEYANSRLYSTSRSDKYTSANIALPSQITVEEQRKLEMKGNDAETT